jgi:hypothetical protein
MSIDKFGILNTGQSNTLSKKIYANGNLLPVVLSCRNLGFVVSSDLTPSAHIKVIVAKARHRANLILCCSRVMRHVNFMKFLKGILSVIIRLQIV